MVWRLSRSGLRIERHLLQACKQSPQTEEAHPEQLLGKPRGPKEKVTSLYPKSSPLLQATGFPGCGFQTKLFATSSVISSGLVISRLVGAPAEIRPYSLHAGLNKCRGVYIYIYI